MSKNIYVVVRLLEDDVDEFFRTYKDRDKAESFKRELEGMYPTDEFFVLTSELL